ncbi:phospholipase A2, minor isoenzyme-like isoform X2 [Chiloscyllium plagiosum]|uniref:phospholipase A2, minor isoenzyme-like isoform X2 n=1 Tax=Chiloscyllium plagiosum TaxID=36176 RepID=UPI001CB856BE|nr:phospholipase A2, minor isoenzyme-like isoform X2 [Chiloscyllium plagiosum]
MRGITDEAGICCPFLNVLELSVLLVHFRGQLRVNRITMDLESHIGQIRVRIPDYPHYRCCQIHDHCYGGASKIKECRPIYDNPYIKLYKYSCSSDMITCGPDNSPCEAYICECDRQAAMCFAEAPYNEEYKHLDTEKHCV